jgi:hypothetical protein
MLRPSTIIPDIPMAALPQQVIPDPEAENDFDMDRVVMDPEYRRRIIGRLRRGWRVAATRRQETSPVDEAALADSEAADSEDD